jgi:hypothetical protein
LEAIADNYTHEAIRNEMDIRSAFGEEAVKGEDATRRKDNTIAREFMLKVFYKSRSRHNDAGFATSGQRGLEFAKDEIGLACAWCASNLSHGIGVLTNGSAGVNEGAIPIKRRCPKATIVELG